MLTRRDLLKSVLLLSVLPECLTQTALAQESGSIEPFFFIRSKVWQGVDFKKGNTPFPFMLSQEQLLRAIDSVVTAMHDSNMVLPIITERKTETIATQIIHAVDGAITTAGLHDVNKFTREWLIAEAVCEYVRMNVTYDHSDAVGGTANQPAEVQIARSTWKYIFGQQNPTGVCWGIAVCVRDLARATGLRCDFVNGNWRELGGSTPAQKDRNHGTVCFTLAGSIEVPADVSSSVCDYQNNHKSFSRRKINSWMVLPRLTEEWELFLATFNSDIGAELDISGDQQNRHKFLTMSYSEWAGKDTGYLRPLLQQYQAWENSRQS